MRKKCSLCGSTWGVAIDGLCVNHRREKIERTTGKTYGYWKMFYYNPDGTPINPKNKYLLINIKPRK
jgi:hypothetical protein